MPLGTLLGTLVWLMNPAVPDVVFECPHPDVDQQLSAEDAVMA